MRTEAPVQGAGILRRHLRVLCVSVRLAAISFCSRVFCCEGISSKLWAWDGERSLYTCHVKELTEWSELSG